MKNSFVFLFSLLLLLLVTTPFSLYTPLPSFLPQEGFFYDEAYFITKFGNHNLQLFEKNNFVITEEELNGFIAYGLEKKNWFSSNHSSFQPSHWKIGLIDNQVLFKIYGKLYRVPVKIELLLTPRYEDQNIYFTIDEAKLSKIKIPKSLLLHFLQGILPMEVEGAGQLVLTLKLPQVLTIDQISFEAGQVVLWYHLNRDEVLHQLLQEISDTFSVS